MLLDAKVKKIEFIHPGLAIFRIEPDGWQLPAFKSGQYVVLGLPVEAPRCIEASKEDTPEPEGTVVKRAYSISSASNNSAYLEFYINLIPSGSLTPRLFALRPGDHIFLGSKITGMFTIDEVPLERNLLFVATGTGLAPYISMIRTHLLEKQERQLCILHGARHSWELGYRSLLNHWQSFIDNFSYYATISRPDDEPEPWHGYCGHVDTLIDKNLHVENLDTPFSSQNASVFLCGNPAMIEEMIVLFEQKGFQLHSKKTPGNIHTEKFW